MEHDQKENVNKPKISRYRKKCKHAILYTLRKAKYA